MEQKQGYDYSSFRLEDTLPVSGMTVGMAITTFRQAKDCRKQLHSLADQECCSEDDIKAMLLANGVSYKEFPRAPRKKAPVEVKPEDDGKFRSAPDPTPAPAAKPARKSKVSPPPPPKKFNRPRPRLCRLRRCLTSCEVCSFAGMTWPMSWPRSTRSSTRYVGCSI